ncbi:YkvA family protein [Peribacillus sp. NPDC097295]|uniref:YkvA family protein n=1 Tax=Peribacillus sp. NPDC097295 TaxID=3364402 RepID=UPI0037F3EB35
MFNRLTKKTKVALVASILYVIVPTDLIPDFIVGFGQVDDAAVLLFLGKCIYTDLFAKKSRSEVLKG